MASSDGATNLTLPRDPLFAVTQSFCSEDSRAAHGLLSLSRSPPPNRRGSRMKKQWDIVLGGDKDGRAPAPSAVRAIPVSNAPTPFRYAAHPRRIESSSPVHPAPVSACMYSQPLAPAPAGALLAPYPPAATRNTFYIYSLTHSSAALTGATQPLQRACNPAGAHPPGRVTMLLPPYHHSPSHSPVTATHPCSVWTPVDRVEGRAVLEPRGAPRVHKQTRSCVGTARSTAVSARRAACKTLCCDTLPGCKVRGRVFRG